MKDHRISGELLDKYLDNACTKQEIQLVEIWYNSFENEPNLQTVFPEVVSFSYRGQLFDRIKQRIKEQEFYPENTEIGRLKTFSPAIWYVAASILLISVVAFWVFKQSQSEKVSTNVATLPPRLLSNTGATIMEVVLPDSSEVWLQPSSTLSYGSSYGEVNREVTLEGEAFFVVSKNAQKTFIIHCGKMTTEVLGTSFNVRAYKNQDRFKVSVVIGKVADSSPKQKIILTAQQQVTYDPVSGQLTEHRKAASNIHKEWGKASINFEWASVSEVAKSLEKTFGVEIKFEDPKLKNCYLRADFTNMRLPMILDLLCRSVDAKYTLKDDVIVVSGPGC